jgi:starch phosphorylase
MPGSTFPLEVQPRIPAELERLREMANDLMYSWDRSIRSLFYRLDRELWSDCGHNPKAFLRRVSQHRLNEAALDRSYMEEYHRVTSAYDNYRDHRSRSELMELFNPREDLRASRSTRVVWVYWRGTTVRPPATWVCPLWRSGCFTRWAILPRP